MSVRLHHGLERPAGARILVPDELDRRTRSAIAPTVLSATVREDDGP